MVSLLKAWWGDAATADNDYRFDYLPRLTGSHSTYDTVQLQIKGNCKGYFLMGENPAVGSANAKMQRLGMANLDWLVVRDFSLIESATWWKDGPGDRERRAAHRGDRHRGVLLPGGRAHREVGQLHQHQADAAVALQAVEPTGDARSDLWFMYHLGKRIRRSGWPGRPTSVDRPVLDLTWDYPTTGSQDEPIGEAVLAEINGWDAEGNHLSSYEDLKADGTTSCGCWIYCGVYEDGVNQAARRKPAKEQSWVSPEWGWAWPANRRTLYNRASADPDGNPWSERKASSGGTRTGEVDRARHPGLPADQGTVLPARPTTPRGSTRSAASTRSSCSPTARAGCTRRSGWSTGRCRRTTSRRSRRSTTCSTSSRATPCARRSRAGTTAMPRADASPGSEVYPYVVTTYRLTEHFTAGGMSRWLPYLAELQPAMFVEVSPELAAERKLENAGWATIVTARGAIEARVLVTDRMSPLHGRRPDDAPDRHALPLGPERPDHRRRLQRAVVDLARPRTSPSRRSRRWRRTSAPADGLAGPRGCATSRTSNGAPA